MSSYPRSRKRKGATVVVPAIVVSGQMLTPSVSVGVSVVVNVPTITVGAIACGGGGRIIVDGTVTVPTAMASASASPPEILFGSSATVKPPPAVATLKFIAPGRSKSATVRVEGMGVATVAIYQSVTVQVGPPEEPPSSNQWYVSSTASLSGDGSFANPWQLQTAFNKPTALKPGDTVWIRGGTYTGNFNIAANGTSIAPIKFRAYSGERVILDSGTAGNYCVTIAASYVWLWGVEIVRSDPNPTIGEGSNLGPGAVAGCVGVKVINCIVHDASVNGIGAFTNWQESEIYGCVVYNNGRDNSTGSGNYAYDLYTQSNANGSKLFKHNLFMQSFGNYAIHAYAGAAYLENLTYVENVAVGQWCFLAAPSNNVAHNMTADGNMFRTSIQIGFGVGTANSRFINNTVYEPSNSRFALKPDAASNTGMTMTGNTIVAYVDPANLDQLFPTGNTYYRPPAKPVTNTVRVFKNVYEAGRANLVVFNFAGATSQAFDVSGVLSPGQTYKVLDANDILGQPVLTGTYSGGSITVPLTGNQIATPISVPPGRSAPASPLPSFGAFVLVQGPIGSSWYASPNASVNGDGSIGNPWQLQTALTNAGAKIQPGDTLNLRGGTYSGCFNSQLTGTAASPIIVRSYPGEWAKLDGGTHNMQTADGKVLIVAGSYVWFRDFEVMSSATDHLSQDQDHSVEFPVDVNCPGGIASQTGVANGTIVGNKFINLIVHDTTGDFGLFSAMRDTEVNGCIVYFSGWYADVPPCPLYPSGYQGGKAHNFYVQNQYGTKTVKDCIVFGSFNLNTQFYGSNEAYLNNPIWVGNFYFDPTRYDMRSTHTSGISLSMGGGGGSHLVNPYVDSNVFWGNELMESGSANVLWGDWSLLTPPGVFTNNVMMAQMVVGSADNDHVRWSTPTTFSGNTFLQDPYGGAWGGGYTTYLKNTFPYPMNTYYNGVAPTSGTIIRVRPNEYEAGRSHVCIINWASASTVNVDLSSTGLVPGDLYAIYNGANPLGPAVASGTYTGAPVAFPTGALTNATPSWTDPPAAAFTLPSTGPKFNVYLVKKVPANSWYVSPTGSSSNNGSFNSPWDLQTAMNHPAVVQPGDTIWLRGGTYTPPANTRFLFKLVGTAAKPIIVRQYPGERAMLSSNYPLSNAFYVESQYTWYWGFEITSPSTTRQATTEWDPSSPSGPAGMPSMGLKPYGGVGVPGYDDPGHWRGNKYINLKQHDTLDNSTFQWETDCEWSGGGTWCLGWIAVAGSSHGHGYYVQNNNVGSKLLDGMVFFGHYAQGIQIYGSDQAPLYNITQKNCTFADTSYYGSTNHQREVCWGGGGGAQPLTNFHAINNMVYRGPNGDAGTSDVFLGDGSDFAANSTIEYNYFATVALWGNSVVTIPNANVHDNTFMSDLSGPYGHPPNNTYLGIAKGSYPTSGKKIDVWKSPYEPNYGKVTIFNWDLSPTVSVDVSSVLALGAAYQVRDAMNYYAGPIACGTYAGGNILIPMLRRPIAMANSDSTLPTPLGPRFGVFVICDATTAEPAQPNGNQWYVATNGSSGNSGSIGSPWDLQTALNQPASVKPGDTIWIRGGTYSGKFTAPLTGTCISPIVVRNYQDGTGFGERVILRGPAMTDPADCILNLTGSYVWIWGLEFDQAPTATKTYLGQTISCRNSWYTSTSSPPDAVLIDAIDSNPQGSGYHPRPGQKIINCRFHDVRQSISGVIEQINCEIYGNLHWNIGYDEEPFPLAPQPPNTRATVWSAGTAYVYGDAVSKDSVWDSRGWKNYVCIQANTGQTPPDNNYGDVNAYWITCFPSSQRGHGFPTYFQNQTSYSGAPADQGTPVPSRKLFKDNIGWGGFTGIFKFYGSGNANETQNVDMVGNVTAEGGKLSTYGTQDDFLFGGGGANAHYLIDSNLGYLSPGYNVGPGQAWYLNGNGIGTFSDITITSNFVASNWGLETAAQNASNVKLAYNTFMGGSSFESLWPTATYHNNWKPGSAPTSNYVFVKPNQYERGRCTVVIYNYALSSTVSVDLSGSGLVNGQHYEIRNAFCPHGAGNSEGGDQVVATGTFNSASPTVSFPMTGLVDPVQPYGYSAKPAGETWHTLSTPYPRYGIFLVLPTA